MHFVISGTWGPTDPTRAMLPFIFAASAVQDGDTVTLMLFHDSVLMAARFLGASCPRLGTHYICGIYTATRLGEVRAATFDEINSDTEVWTISAMRMKAGVEHR